MAGRARLPALSIATKLWLVGAVLIATIMLGWTIFSIDQNVDHRLDTAGEFNRDVYEGIQLTVDVFGPAFAEGGFSIFTPEDVARYLGEGTTNIDLVEVYALDGTLLFTTNPDREVAPLPDDMFAQARAGTVVTGSWEYGDAGGPGRRIERPNAWRIVRGNEMADEFWGPLRGPDGELIGVTHALVGLPGLRGVVWGVIITHAVFAAVAITVLGLALGLLLDFMLRRRLAALTSTTRLIREGDLSLRAPVSGRDELSELAVSFNAMADELERQATTDSLTGLLNHRYGNVALDRALRESIERRKPLTAVIADVDGFKLFNDTYGHPLGDEVLKLVARVLTELCRDGGMAARYGGDEFLIILPGTGKREASRFIERLTTLLGEQVFQTPGGERIPIRMSAGFASYPEDSDAKDHLLARADASMYEAKRFGVAEQPASAPASGDDLGSQFGALDALVQSLQYRDHYTKTHSDVVAEYAAKLALRAGLSDEAARALRIAGVLHDVGKIVVPDEVLKKPSRLSDEEYEMMKRHPLVGEMLIRESPFLEDVIQAVGCHHERYDGKGYPRGLKGEAIPLLGRVIAIADAYGAMCLDRPYRKALSRDEIVAELRAGAGTQFDPGLVERFIDVLVEAEPKAA